MTDINMDPNAKPEATATTPATAPKIKDKPTPLKRFVFFLRVMGTLYVLLGAAFFFYPNVIVDLLNLLPNKLSIATAIPYPSEKFWIALSTASMGMLATVSFLGAESPHIRGYSLAHMFNKVIAASCFLYLFLHESRYFAYILGVFTDYLIALITAWYLIRTARIKKPE